MGNIDSKETESCKWFEDLCDTLVGLSGVGTYQNVHFSQYIYGSNQMVLSYFSVVDFWVIECQC